MSAYDRPGRRAAASLRQERILRRADRALRRSDPDLASMLSIFARLAAAEAMPAREQLRPQPTRVRRVLLWPVSAVTFVVAFAAGGGRRTARPVPFRTR
jgi:hypothetical protein